MSDLISRQAAISMIDDLMGGYIPIGTSTFKEGVVDGYARAISRIKTLPSAEKKGKWIQKKDPYGFFETIPVCSECGHTTKMRETYDYCPNCGAKMDVPDNDVGEMERSEE